MRGIQVARGATPQAGLRHRYRVLADLWLVRIVACIEDPDVIEKILTHLDTKAEI
jgi:hypothetical protein